MIDKEATVTTTSERPTTVRYGVLIFAFALAVITYIDRVCIAGAAPFIIEELKLTPVAIGMVFSAFTLAYSIFEVPSGWLGDIMGARKVLTRIVIWWSVFTMLTGAAWNFASLCATRFLFGAGEAGAFPNISRSFSRWFHASERGRAHGVVFMGTRLGGAVTPLIVAALIAAIGWRKAFVVFGVLGFVWAALWYRWYRDVPAKHPGVNQAEIDLIRGGQASEKTEGFLAGPLIVPWRKLLLSPNLIFICLMYFSFGYGLYFYLTWLPTYLVKARGFSSFSSGLLAGLPLLVAAGANIFGGLVTDRLAKQYSLRASRCAIGAASFFASAIAIAAVAITENPLAAALLVALAAGLADFSLPACWAVCLDVGKDYTGIVTGCMNTFGNLGGTLCPLVIGFIVERWGNWNIPFVLTGLVYLAGAGFWLLINPEKSLTKVD